MNDWLDYQGSGSSRAYIAHYGVKGMKWDPGKLFGKPQETDKQKVKQIKANDKLVYALYEQYNKYESEYGEANMGYKDYDTVFIPKQQEQINEAKDTLKELETKYSNLSKTRPLEATQRYSHYIWAQKKNIQELEAGLERLKKTQMDYKRKMEIASVKADDVRKKITEVEGDSSAISRSRRIKQSYFDIPADEFIMHAKKGGNSMNDWLDYVGSGSSRSYSNTIEHAAVSGRTTAPKPSNRNVPANNAYNILNSNLDQFYKSTQDLINLARNLRTSVESMISAARNAKKNLTLCEGKYKMWETAYNKIDSDIDAANISDMQKTALRNKLERISDGAGEIDKINTGYEIDINMDTFNNLISNIQNAMRR